MPTVRTTIPSITVFDPKPLYALAGAGDLAVERFRALVAEFPTQVKELRKQAEDFPARAQSLPVELRKQAEEFSSKASSAYDDFAVRGAKVVAGLRGEKPGKTVGTKARKTAKPAKRATAKKTTAKKTTKKAAAKKAPSSEPVPAGS
jgi:hypothetical protein